MLSTEVRGAGRASVRVKAIFVMRAYSRIDSLRRYTFGRAQIEARRVTADFGDLCIGCARARDFFAYSARRPVCRDHQRAACVILRLPENFEPMFGTG